MSDSYSGVGRARVMCIPQRLAMRYIIIIIVELFETLQILLVRLKARCCARCIVKRKNRR